MMTTFLLLGACSLSDPCRNNIGGAVFRPVNGGQAEDWSERFPIGGTVQLDTPGTLTLCEGDWEASLLVATDGVRVEGQGAELTTLLFEGASVIRVEDALRFELADLTVQGEQLDQDARVEEDHGLVLESSEALVEGVVFLNNGSEPFQGSGLHATDSTVTVADSRFEGALGGGAAFHSSELSIQDSTFEGNASPVGGGLSLMDSSATLPGLQFLGNEAAKGGALACHGSDVELLDSVFADNVGSYGAGINVDDLNDDDEEWSLWLDDSDFEDQQGDLRHHDLDQEWEIELGIAATCDETGCDT